MSQVRNLRAMFENKGETSPPDRGRTQTLQPQASDSPRPLSRVRTSFITVEKDGRVGLQRDPSTDSAISQTRKVSAGSEGETVFSQTDATSTTAGDSIEALSKPAVAIWQTPVRANIPISEEPVKPFVLTMSPPTEATVAPDPAPVSVPSLAAAPALTRTMTPAPAPTLVRASTATPDPDTNGDVGAKEVTSKASTAKAERIAGVSANKFSKSSADKTDSGPTSAKTAATVKGSSSSPAGTASTIANNGKTGAAKPPAVSTPSTVGHTAARTKTTNNVRSKDASKPAAITTAVTTTNAKTGKNVPKTISTTTANLKSEKKATAATLKTPTSPTKFLAPKLSSKTPERKTPVPSEKTLSATPRSTASSSAGRSTGSSSAKKPQAIQTFPTNGIGFVKPKPRSPTRPVQLPAGLMTHTASSATKANVPRQSLSRQSGNYDLAHHPVARSSSRASMAAGTATTATTQRGLKRQNSTINRPRPSIGPPPKQPARDHPVIRKEKDVDEGFLARMMRPTQSSASKTSPPRKHAAVSPKRTVARSGNNSATKRQASVAPAKKTVSTAPPKTPTPTADAAALLSTGSESTPGGNVLPTEEASPAVGNIVTEDAPLVEKQGESESTAAPEEEAIAACEDDNIVHERAAIATEDDAVASGGSAEVLHLATDKLDAKDQEEEQDVGVAQPVSGVSLEVIVLADNLSQEEQNTKSVATVEGTVSESEGAEPEVIVDSVATAVEVEAVESI